MVSPLDTQQQDSLRPVPSGMLAPRSALASPFASAPSSITMAAKPPAAPFAFNPASDNQNTVGMRHNNPLSLYGNDKWNGLAGKTANGMLKFKDPYSGWRAGYKNIANQFVQRPNETVREYLQKYDPHVSDEIIQNYVRFVEQNFGISGETLISQLNPLDVADALAGFESNMSMPDDVRKKLIDEFNGGQE